MLPIAKSKQVNHIFDFDPSREWIFYFQLKPTKPGELSIVVNLYQRDKWLGSARVSTQVVQKDTYGDVQQIDGSVQQIEVESHSIGIREPYIDFELHIDPSCRAIARSSQGESPPVTVTVDAEDIQLALELIEQDKTNDKLLKALGQKLYTSLFPPQIHTLLQQTEAVARAEGMKLRIRLRIEAAAVASLPIEFIRRDMDTCFLAQNPNTAFARYFNLPLPPGRVRRRQGALHLLTIIANPEDQKPLEVNYWDHLVEQALIDLKKRGQVTTQTVKLGSVDISA